MEYKCHKRRRLALLLAAALMLCVGLAGCESGGWVDYSTSGEHESGYATYKWDQNETTGVWTVTRTYESSHIDDRELEANGGYYLMEEQLILDSEGKYTAEAWQTYEIDRHIVDNLVSSEVNSLVRWEDDSAVWFVTVGFTYDDDGYPTSATILYNKRQSDADTDLGESRKIVFTLDEPEDEITYKSGSYTTSTSDKKTLLSDEDMLVSALEKTILKGVTSNVTFKKNIFALADKAYEDADTLWNETTGYMRLY
jgi:hypothetical protein